MNEQPWCNINNFLTRNEMLIAVLAGRILNGLPYNRDDVKMEAAVAYYETLDYINAFKKTKFSSVFTWFYQKRLYAKRRVDTTYVAFGGRGFPPSGTDRSGTAPDRHAAGRDTSVPPSFPVLIPGGSAFTVCLESFMGKVSIKVYRALITLSELSDAKTKKKTLRNLFKCPTSKNIEALVGSLIRCEIKESGAHLYTAVCTNGSESKVVVCARREDEARRYLAKYGDPEEITMIS